MIQKLSKLIDVKSIITFAIVFTYLFTAVMGRVNIDKFETIVLMVITFYFGTQYQKKEVKRNENNSV